MTHRIRLDDMALIKDNHLVLADSIEQSIRLTREKINGCLLLECEVKNLAEMVSAVMAGSDIVMLDNFSPKQAKDAITQIRKMGIRKKVKVEISGRIDPHNIADYARLQPDIISLGYITHSPKAIDYSLEIMSNSDCQPS